MYEDNDYNRWNDVKKKMTKRESPLFHEREVWITSIGLALHSVALSSVHFLAQESVCICTHVRTFSSKRLQRRLGKIPEKLWIDVLQKSAELLAPPQVPYGDNTRSIHLSS